MAEKASKLSNPWVFRILIFLAFGLVIFNVFYALSTTLGVGITGLTIGGLGGTTGATTRAGSTEVAQGTMLQYGVTFDNAGYEKLLEYYRTITLDSLTPEQKERFVRIGTGNGDINNARTGCGPCCGIQNGAAIDGNGNARCGCGHNLALIGLMKHLVKNYGDKYSDDQIFNEVVKWKKLFFPGRVADDGSVIR